MRPTTFARPSAAEHLFEAREQAAVVRVAIVGIGVEDVQSVLASLDANRDPVMSVALLLRSFGVDHQIDLVRPPLDERAQSRDFRYALGPDELKIACGLC